MSTPNSANALRKFADPYWSAPGAALYLGDVRDVLRQLPARSAHCCVTSPPYWGLRDYGVGGQIGMEDADDCLGWATKKPCGACFVCHMVEVFSELRRVLRDDGTLWLNLGDTFDNGQGMVPAAVAMALRADGWKLVQDIIWAKPNPMPESVTNRCSKSHEHIFLLAKGNKYYFDSVAIEEPGKTAYKSSDFIPKSDKDRNGDKTDARQASRHNRTDDVVLGTANKRDVWSVPTRGYPGAHFACYSPELITPCILAGTSEHGCCAECGRQYERVAVKVGGRASEVEDESKDRSIPSNRNGLAGSGSTMCGTIPRRETAGWRKACGCATDEVEPCAVLDPFCGSATTVATALQLGRAGVGIDLSEEYLLKCAIPRIVAVGDPRRPATSALPAAAPPPFPSWRG